MLRVVPFLLLALLVVGWRRAMPSLGSVLYAVFGSILLQVAFSFLKSSIPLIVPFYADRLLADFDRWIHGGYDPWVLAHQWTAGLPVDHLVPVYMWVWAIPALAFPVIIAVTEAHRERAARFTILYIACWLILGNLLALAASSVGPVYYDALIGGDRFAHLRDALESSGISSSLVGLVQEKLWSSYAEQNMALGLGISAFPSVHVGVATLAALYMAERSRWLVLPGLVFLAITLFLSVYTGYHYAVDGYFSMLFIVGLWYALRRVTITELDWPGLRVARNRMPVASR